MYLMAWLAIINSGHIDWEKHIPTMYTRILKTFNLPVSYKKMRCMKVSKLFEDRVASWIVSSLVNSLYFKIHFIIIFHV